jgi:hypothetical protein
MSTTRPSNDHEARFHALVDYAEQLSGGVDALLIASGHHEPLVRDDMPNGLLFELDYLCRVQFDATLHDLRHPWLSHAAPTHLRPLLEGLAQIAFILGHETGHPVGTAQQRAICLGLARVREEDEAMKAARPETVPVGNIQESEQRVAIFEEMHQRIGCAYAKDVHVWKCRQADGAPCDHRSMWPCRITPAQPRKLTSPTMRELSKRMNFHFRDVEVASSLVLHMLLADRLWVDTGHGTNAFANAKYVMRASTLALAVSTYGVSIAFILDSVESAAGAAVRAFMSAMWKKPDMIEIGTGMWDQPGATDR